MTTTLIDLLFYNRKLERLVEIDLKLGAFKAEYQSVSVCRKATRGAYAARELGGTQNTAEISWRGDTTVPCAFFDITGPTVKPSSAVPCGGCRAGKRD